MTVPRLHLTHHAFVSPCLGWDGKTPAAIGHRAEAAANHQTGCRRCKDDPSAATVMNEGRTGTDAVMDADYADDEYDEYDKDGGSDDGDYVGVV